MTNILASDPETSFDKLIESQLDITAPQHVQLLIDRRRGVVWVNVNGVCALRACAIEFLTIEEVQ